MPVFRVLSLYNCHKHIVCFFLDFNVFRFSVCSIIKMPVFPHFTIHTLLVVESTTSDSTTTTTTTTTIRILVLYPYYINDPNK